LCRRTGEKNPPSREWAAQRHDDRLIRPAIAPGPASGPGQRTGLSATAQINRRDFGIDITIPMDGGGVVVGDKVSISLAIEAVLQK
jgi:hypothetical protein